MGAGGALNSIASSFGFDLSEMQTSDAITPMLYPDLMDDNGFIHSLMDIKLKSLDGEINTTYHDYLQKYQKWPWWSYPIQWIKKLLPTKKDIISDDIEFSPYLLSKKELKVYKAARKKINIAIDKKTGLITINAEAQDPLISKMLTDSIQERLQVFITNYRTNKARIDYEYYKKLTANAKQDYEKTRRQYASMADASTNLSLRSVVLKMEDVENDMQLKLNTYMTLNNQLQAAKAKVQEKTPAFTVIKGAAMPDKPDGPKRMIFVGVMLLLACFAIFVYTIRDFIIRD